MKRITIQHHTVLSLMLFCLALLAWESEKNLLASEVKQALPASKANQALPASEANQALPASKANQALPASKAKQALPASKAKQALPASKAKQALPASEAHQAKVKSPGFAGIAFDRTNPAPIIKRVIPYSPASRAKLQAGDTITAVGFGNQRGPIYANRHFQNALRIVGAGETVDVQFKRDGKLRVTKLTLEGTARYGQKAPELKLTQWDGTPVSIADSKGKIIYLYCFQSWCPGCKSHGFPTLQKVSQHFQDDQDVLFLAVQTVFEGQGINSYERGLNMVRQQFKLNIPYAHDPGPDGRRSQIMKDYRTQGTPWTIFIDKKGIVRSNDFSYQIKDAIQIIETLKREP